MKTIQSIAFDFSVHGVTPRIYGKQGDVNSRFVNISLFDQSTAWIVPSGALLSIRFRMPSGASGLYDSLPDGSSAFEVFENTVSAALAEPIFAESGPVRCELSIAAENAGVTTWCFIVSVEGASVSDQEIPEDYYNGFLSVAAQVAADAKRAEEAANSVDPTLLMNKTMYDPEGAVEAAGGIAQYAEDYLNSQKGNANGVAALDETGKILNSAIPIKKTDLSISAWPSSVTITNLSFDCTTIGNITYVNVDVTFLSSEGNSDTRLRIRSLPHPSHFPCVISFACARNVYGGWGNAAQNVYLWDNENDGPLLGLGSVQANTEDRYIVSFSYAQ